MVSDALILITAMLAGWAVHLINDIGHFGYGFVPDQSFDYASMCEAAVKHQSRDNDAVLCFDRHIRMLHARHRNAEAGNCRQ